MRMENSSFTIPNEKDEALEQLIKTYSKEYVYPAKKIFLTPGQHLQGVYYIAKGRTRHYMIGEDGTEKILYTLSDGWFYGETPVSLGTSTGLYSQAEIETHVYIMPYQNYEKLLDMNKYFRDAIFENCSKKMLIMRHEIENLTFNSCKDRLKRLFCSTADMSCLLENQWYNLKVHYTQQELSAIIGSTRITVSKAIKELCDENFIRILNRKTQVSAIACERIVKH